MNQQKLGINSIPVPSSARGQGVITKQLWGQVFSRQVNADIYYIILVLIDFLVEEGQLGLDGSLTDFQSVGNVLFSYRR